MQKIISKLKIIKKNRYSLEIFRFCISFLVIIGIIISPFDFRLEKNKAGDTTIIPTLKSPSVMANNQFTPTNGVLRNGTERAITSVAVAATDGVNVGSWKGTLADDNFHWMVDSTSTGYDLNLTVGGVELNGANMMMIETEIDLDATIPQTYFQICDWESALGSGDGDADSDCGTEDDKGVWRTLNLRKTVFNSATATAFHFQIYDGYWSDGSNTPRSTPLANFVSPSNEIKVRYYSTTSSDTSPVAIDYLRIYSVINPVYSPADFTDNNGAGSTTGDYTDTVLGFHGAAATFSDNNRNGAGGTADPGGSVADFYWSFKNAKQYTGMNTIVVRAETSCDATGNNYRPQIYNFVTNGGQWEEISANNIACSATDATNIWSFTPATFSNYFSGGTSGEVRVGFKGQATGTQIIRADFIYIMLGTTNTDENDCEISFGSGTATDCTNTRDIDTIGAASVFNNPAEDESTNQGHEYYPADNDQDANVEEAGAAHVKFSVTQPSNTAVTGLFYASRHMSGTAGTVQGSLRDYSGSYAGAGGFTDVGGTGTTALTYTDNIVHGSSYNISSGGPPGLINNPEDYLDSVGNEMWMRLRTSTDPSAASNVTNQWDFAFVSLQWIEDADHPSKSYQFTSTAGSLTNGTAQNFDGVNGATAEGRNVGWKGALASDSYHWVSAADGDGLDMNFTLGNAQLNGANSLMIESLFDLDASSPTIVFQICDWVDDTGADDVKDAVCNPTTGGWRTINLRDVGFSSAVSSGLTQHYQIYNGYWSDGSNAPRDTPLTNFLNGSDEIKIRVHSTSNGGTYTGLVAVDSLRVYAVVNPVYSPADLETVGAGAITGDYTNAIYAGNIGTGSQTGSDDTYSGSLSAGGAETAPNSYWSFKNIEYYAQMNTIVVRSEHSCSSASGMLYRPVIYKFTGGGSWTDISAGSIACATADNTNAWSLTPTAPDSLITDYISSGEIRIGFRSLSGTGTTIRADWMYIMLGTTNTDSSDCEISFGTGTATDCTKTRDLDFTGPLSTWDIAKEDEAATRATPFYALDNDGDIDTEEAAAGHVKFSMASPQGAGATGIFYSMGLLGGLGYNELATGRYYGTVRDTSGFSGTTGGFSPFSTYQNTTMSYLDNVNSAVVTSGGISGITANPEDYVDAVNNEVWYRFRNSISGSVNNNLSTRLDFIMMSLQWIESGTNTAPNVPTNLGPAGYIDAAGWMNDNTPTFTFDLSDSDVGQQVQYEIQISDDSSFSNIITDYTSALAAQGTFSFTVGQAAGGGTYNGGHGIGGQILDDSTVGGGYYWKVKTIDSIGAESNYEEAGTDAQIDFRVDATAPTSGTVYDGSAGDQDWNDGSLTELSANWLNFNADTSGLQKYEYAIRRQDDDYYWSVCIGAGTWQAEEKWCDNSTGTSFTQNNLNLQTGVTYYVSVKTTDNAGNIESAIDSNGQQVLPLLSFSINSNTVAFANLNNGNGWKDSQTIVTTTSTNASQGYSIKIYNDQPLTSIAYPSKTIPDFSGTWNTPTLWPLGTYGFGYTSSDTLVQGSDRFSGGNNYAAFTQTLPGDVCADHTDAVNGSTGAVTNEQFTITYKVAVPDSQAASTYQATSTYIVTANY